jgi:hypothetical protein
VSDPAKPWAESVRCLFAVIGAAVRPLAAFAVGPDSFGWIQLRWLARQPLPGEPVSLRPQEVFHHLAPMCRKAIPHPDDRVARDEALPVLEEGHQAFGVKTVWLGASEQACLPAIPAKTERRRYRGLGPVIPAAPQDRCLSSRRPRPADRGWLGESGFVLQEDPGALISSVFLGPVIELSSHRRPDPPSAPGPASLVSAPTSSWHPGSSRRDRDGSEHR